MPAQDKSPGSTLKDEKNDQVQVVKLEPLKVILEWESPLRPFKKRDREFFSTIGAIVFLVIVILFFLKEWFLICAIVAFSFLVYILSTIPPEKIKHKITNRSIISAGVQYPWEALARFWIKKKGEEKILFVETLIRFPRRLILLLGEEKEDIIRKVLSDYLPEEEPEETWYDKASEWLSRAIPLQRSS